MKEKEEHSNPSLMVIHVDDVLLAVSKKAIAVDVSKILSETLEVDIRENPTAFL